MPDKGNIEQFNNPINGIEPQDRGGQAFAQEGRRVGSFFHQIGEGLGQDVKTLGDALVEHQTNTELAQGVKTATDLELQLAVTRPQFFKENQGPDAAAKWQQHVQEVTSTWAGHFQTERGKLWSQEEGARIYGQSVREGIADQSDIDLANNLAAREGSANNLIAMSRLDPTKTDGVLDQLDRNDQQFQPALMDPGKWAENHAAQVKLYKEQAALNHYEGLADMATQQFAGGATESPAYAAGLKELDSGKYADLLGEAGVQRAREALEHSRTSGTEQFRINKDADVKQSVLSGDNDFLSLYHDLNTKTLNGQPMTSDDNDAIVAYEKSHPHNTAQSMELERFRTIAAKDALHQTFVHSDGDTLNDFWQRASLPPGDPRALKPTEVTSAQHDGKLNPVDANLLLKDVAQGRKGAGASDPQAKFYQAKIMQWASATLRSQIVGGSQDPSGLAAGGGVNPAAQMAWGEAMREVVQGYQGWLKTEKPAVAFDIMTNPNNPRRISQRLGYWQAAAASGQPEDFFSSNPDPDAYVTAHGGVTAVPGSTPLPGKGSVPAAAPPARQPGESADAYLKRRGL